MFFPRRLTIVTLIAALSGCATYGDWVGEMEQQIAAHDVAGALRTLDERAGGRARDAVLYDLNRALLLRMEGDYVQSNAAFESAKAAIERLDAVSVSEQTGALAINDMMRSYTAEPYERALLHVYAALNYLDLGQPEAARVEILQLDVLLGQEEDAPDGAGFARYLSGMIFEALGQYDDAMIAYRQAYAAYRRDAAAGGAPASLGRDLVRTAARVGGLEDELRRYRTEFGLAEAELPGPRAEEGELIFLLHSGLAPVKRDQVIGASTPEGRVVAVAMPYYEMRTPRVTGARLSAGDAVVATEVAEDVAAVAVATLEREKPLILLRAISRAAIKHEASEKADQENNTLGAVINIAGIVSERADTRSWSTLPNRIYLARLPLPDGRHEVRVELAGDAAARDYVVELAPGEKRFISLHWVSAGDFDPLPYRIERRRLQ